MRFWSSYLQGWKKFADFDGYATRKEFWCFSGVNYAVLFLTPVILSIGAEITNQPVPIYYIGLLYTIMSLVLLLPTMAVGIRRMHDIGRSGWWFGIAYLLPLLKRLLDSIFIYHLSPKIYVYVKLALAVTLFWIPVIFVLILCCFKSKSIIQPIEK